MAVKAKKEDIETCRNPEFANWLWLWYKEAQESDSRYQFALRKAFDSMVRCEERLKTGREAVRLDGIGPGISDKLQKRLEKHISDGGEWHYALPSVDAAEVDGGASNQVAKRAKAQKPYIPKFRSIAYAIVMALFERHDSTVKRGELQRLAGPYCNKNSIEDGAFGAALKTLITKDIVELDRPTSGYVLSDDLGVAVGERLWTTSGRTIPDRTTILQAPLATEAALDERWEREDFDIILLIDIREVKSKTERDAFVDGLNEQHIPVSQTQLPLGDIILVAKHKQTKEMACLDVIVERKTDGDLIASITDGRFKEQKRRLTTICPIKHVIYLIEGSGDGLHVANFGEDKYFAAITQAPICEDIYVQRTRSLADTISFLAALYHDCVKRYEGGMTIHRGDLVNANQITGSVPFESFLQVCSKSANLTYRDLFERQLMCIKGVTVESARRLVELFQNYDQLLSAIDRHDVVNVKGWEKVRHHYKL